MNNITCPNDEDLIPLLAGETVDESIPSHLEKCSSCRRRLEMFRSDLDALRSVSLSVPPFAAASSRPPRPSRIGKYLVVGALDGGGQADVYRAVHPTLETELAIKLGRRVVGRLSDHRTLLVAEGKILARLDHPGLARVYDLDFHDDIPFLAMEYVRGPNLRKYAAEGAVSPQRAAAVVAQVGRALQLVHNNGIIHQDIKPQNILMDEAERPRLIDFGMARIRHAWDDSENAASGGTPAFMAPEQARNETGATSARSDIFALGGVLYFLLTGRPPFAGGSIEETLKLAGNCDFDRSALDKPGIPRRLRAICLKAMSARPDDRYARADEFVADLEQFLRRPKQMARYAGIGLAACLLVGLFAAGFTLMRANRPVMVVQNVEGRPPAFEVLITRDGKTLELAAAMPLKPATDRVQVVGRVPSGEKAMMLQVNAKGKFEELTYRESPADGYTRLIFPREEGKLATFDPWEGTEVILIFAGKDDETLERAHNYAETVFMNKSLPAMAPDAVVTLNMNESDGAKPYGHHQPDSKALVESRMDEFRKGLRERNIPVTVLQGVAYSRGPAPEK